MDKNRDGNELEALMLVNTRHRLNQNGYLNKIKSELRGMLLNDLGGGVNSMNQPSSNDPESPTQLVNTLIMEYLDWMGFQYSKDVFVTESGAAASKGRESGVKELPMLLNLAAKLMKEEEK